MVDRQKIGRLSLRAEGASWNAYYAMPDTMERAILLGSIRLAIIMNSSAHKQAFMDLMQAVVSDMIAAAGAMDVAGEEKRVIGRGALAMTEAAMPPRPKTMTPEIARRAARAIAESMCEGGLIQQCEVTNLANDIAKYDAPHADGYAIATRLEREYGWGPNAQWVEALDDFANKVSDLIRDAQAAWARGNGIAPQFGAGVRVKLKSGEVGEIDSVYPWMAACYSVKIDGDPRAESHHRRRVVEFENVEAL